QELMIAIIPHIVRRPDFTAENMRGIAVGNQAGVHLNYSRRPSAQPAATAPAAPKKEEAAPSPVPAPAANSIGPPPPAVPNSPMSMPGATSAAPPAHAPPAALMPPATAPPMDAMANIVTPPTSSTPAWMMARIHLFPYPA